jgi:capsular polysaccharide transport system permease protein
MGADERAAEIMKVQRDIARRRRKRLVLLISRLTFFVLLPTFIVGFYFYRVATPLYATNTEFVIQKAESGAGAPAGLGGLFGGTSFATVQESIVVQSYLESREAMLRLDEELDFREHFSGPDIDPLVRLDPNAPDEAVYSTYRDQLTIGYDPTEGVVKMEMLAADPETSQAFSEALIRYAEERVDQMSQRLREDQMAGARDSYEDAERRVEEAQERVLELQERRGILSTEAEVSTVFQQISTFELELQQERLRLAEIQAARNPNPTRVEVAQNNIERLENLIERLRSGLTEAGGGQASLARVQSELVVAQADLETRQMMLSQALQTLETARVEANRQSLYLSIGVFPVAPDEAAYPRAFENTLLAFLVFSGIYLMVSMTASILREQLSS